MRCSFWRKAAPRPLSHQLNAAVMTQFPDARAVETMRFHPRLGSFANRRAEYVRIFDPGRLKDGELADTSYGAFALTDTRRGALLFEGHIQSINDKATILLSDRHAS